MWRFFTLAWLLGCSGTLDGTRAPGVDAGPRDVGPGVNPDGNDPFRPTDAGVILVDGTVQDSAWVLPDGAVLTDERLGYLYIGTFVNNGVESSYASAEFRLQPRVEDGRCRYHGAGNWDVVSCDESMTMALDRHPRPFPTAGVITILGGAQPVMLNPNPDGTYQYFYQSGVSFPGPGVLTVRASGSAVLGGFSTSVTLPPTLRVLSPDPAVGTLTVDRMRDLEITWNPNPTRSVYIALQAAFTSGGTPRSVRMTQEFYGTEGRGVVPSQALRDFAASMAGTTATLTVLPYNITATRINGWPMQFNVVGRGAQFTVQLR
ncbi:MAG: hypothetical protein HY909_28695 [Deltaproteobacteria bacterium]|nr:hypothetical protein [Deltaproteobacteria bacterium]